MAPLGFGEDYIATAVQPGSESYHFTRAFTIDDPAAYDELNLSLLADDGAVVYLKRRRSSPLQHAGRADRMEYPTAELGGGSR